jgi:transcriptional regulator with XRE-family HTH domain
MTPEQCRAARALLNLEQAELAASAGVSRSTLADFERSTRKPRSSSLEALRQELMRRGIDFIEPNGGGHGVRLRKSNPD